MTTYGKSPVSGDTGSDAIASVETEEALLSVFEYFPHALFLLNQEMRLIESNHNAKIAIKQKMVDVLDGKLDFRSKENNQYVRCIVQRLCAPLGGVENTGERSERFIIRNVDMLCRPYTLTRVSPNCDKLILSIQADIRCSDSKMDGLARAFSLTLSETRIVKMMIAGLKPKEIAYTADISLNTVRSHLRTVYAKMHVSNYNDALTYAIKLIA